MAEERSNVENFDRVDPSVSTLAAIKRDREAGSTDDVLELAGSDRTGHSTDDGPREAEHIKSQIEDTRSQMGETIDAIQDRLSFSNISEQVSEHVNNAVETAKDAVYDATIGKAASIMKNISSEISNSSIVKTASKNPIPFILMGLGAGMLAYQTYSGSKKPNYRRLASQSSGGDRESSLSENVGNKVSALTDSVSSAAGNAYGKVSSAVDGAYTSASDAAGKAYGKVGDLTAAASDKYDYYVEENPLAVGAVALALGAAVGFAIPASSFESRVMGPVREQLVGKAQDTASDLIEKTKQAVKDAGQSVVDAGHTLTDQITSQTDH
ncbi:MAG: DUF3618 domain-containing protein [Acidobacteriota bacterium]